MCGISFVDLHPVSPTYNPSAYLRSHLVCDVIGLGVWQGSFRRISLHNDAFDRPERLARIKRIAQNVIEYERQFAATMC